MYVEQERHATHRLECGCRYSGDECLTMCATHLQWAIARTKVQRATSRFTCLSSGRRMARRRQQYEQIAQASADYSPLPYEQALALRAISGATSWHDHYAMALERTLATLRTPTVTLPNGMWHSTT